VKSHVIMRRVAGYHDLRMDGISDLVLRARGASVMDIGCNRGLVGFEFANNGAALVHGCDNYEPGIATARELFADLRSVRSQFEVVDLTKRDALKVFGEQAYDLMLMLATYHKLKRIMDPPALTRLIGELAALTVKYFAWRGTSESIPATSARRSASRQSGRAVHDGEVAAK
jgi:hypothetical protein